MLRPPIHRGPLIAAGAVVLTVGVALLQVRYIEEWEASTHLIIAALMAALLLWLGFQNRLDGGAPPAFVSVLLVAGLVMLQVALVPLADVLGADFDDVSGTLTWMSLVEAAVAGTAAARRRSAICALIAAVAVAVALLAGWTWIFDTDSATPYRWLLLVLAVVFTIACLPLRGLSLRHSQMMINAAGLAMLGIVYLSTGFLFFGNDDELPAFFEVVVLGAGFGLVAYAAADRAPGPAYIGVAVLAAWVLRGGGEATVKWWPLILLVLGGGAMLAGLRPAKPMPPEPAPYHPDETPLAARTDDDVVVRVRPD